MKTEKQILDEIEYLKNDLKELPDELKDEHMEIIRILNWVLDVKK